MLFIDGIPSKRIKDDNGFLIIKDNPIAKAGVFDYLLSEVQNGVSKDDEKIVKVYRPFDELVRIKDSFQNKPIKFTHLWVGNENKTADGAIGSNIRADEKTGMLYADLIIYNPDLISAIENDKIVELSPAYTGSVVAEYGRNNGVGYEFRQNLNCINHLAVVERGRSGSDLRIADQMFSDDREREDWNKWDEKANTYSEKADEIAAEIKEMGTIVSPSGKRKLESLKRKEQEYRNKAKELWNKADNTADKSENQAEKSTGKKSAYSPFNMEGREGSEQTAIKILTAILGKNLTAKIVAKYDESKGRNTGTQSEISQNENVTQKEKISGKEIKGDDLKENDIKREKGNANAENENTDGKKGNLYRSDTGQFSSKGKGKKLNDERSVKMSDETTFLDSFISYIQRFFDKKDKYRVTIKTPNGKFSYYVKAGDKEYEALSQKYTARAKKSWDTRRVNAEKAEQEALKQGKSASEAKREAKNAAQRANYESRKETKRILEKHLGKDAYSSGKGREQAGGSAEQRWGRESQGSTIRSTKGGTRKANLEKMMLVGNLIANKLKNGNLSDEARNELKKELSHIGKSVGGQAGYVFGKMRTGELVTKRNEWGSELEQERKGEISKRVQKHREKVKAEAERAGIKEAFKQGEQKRKQAETIKANIQKSAISEVPKEKAKTNPLIKSQVKAIKFLIETDKDKAKYIARGLNEYFTGEKTHKELSKNDVLEITKRASKALPELKAHLSGDLKAAIESNSKGSGTGKRVVYRGEKGRFTSKGKGKMERYGDAMLKLINFFKGEQL